MVNPEVSARHSHHVLLVEPVAGSAQVQGQSHWVSQRRGSKWFSLVEPTGLANTHLHKSTQVIFRKWMYHQQSPQQCRSDSQGLYLCRPCQILSWYQLNVYKMGSGHDLICISLIVSEVGHLLILLLATCFSFFLFKSFAHFSIQLPLSYHKNYLYFLEAKPFSFWVSNSFCFPVCSFSVSLRYLLINRISRFWNRRIYQYFISWLALFNLL